jgi:hypothetical protein
MTDDELLARISELSLIDELDMTEEYLSVRALRAVVEYIHRDRTIAIGVPFTDYEKGIFDADRQILAIIKKELK